MGEGGELESWEFQGGTFTATGSWLPVGGKKVAELENKISSIAFTTSYYGNQTIKELYLEGASEDEQYKIYLSKGADLQIRRMSDKVLVARASGFSFASFAEVKEYNSSGISGYVVFDWDNWDDNWIVDGGATNVPTTYLTSQSFGNIDLCPIIKMYLFENDDFLPLLRKAQGLSEIIGAVKLFRDDVEVGRGRIDYTTGEICQPIDGNHYTITFEKGKYNKIYAYSFNSNVGNNTNVGYAFYDENGTFISGGTGESRAMKYIDVPAEAVTFKNSLSEIGIQNGVTLYTESGLAPQVANNTGNIATNTEYIEKTLSRISSVSRFKTQLVKKGLLPLKLLGVGNSWTKGGCNYLGDILSEFGINIEIGVSYAGGASLQSYVGFINKNSAVIDFYRYRNGAWEDPIKQSVFKDIIIADDWDIVTHQQQGRYGGVYDTFQPYLHNIIEWEKEKLPLLPTFFMHATWSFPEGYDLVEEFETLYGSDTEVMYNDILQAYNQAMIDESIPNVLPSAVIVQQTRALGLTLDNFDAGGHLNAIGYFATSCVWAEMLLRKYFDSSFSGNFSILNSTFKPSGVSDENAVQIRQLAKTIVENINTYFPTQE